MYSKFGRNGQSAGAGIGERGGGGRGGGGRGPAGGSRGGRTAVRTPSPSSRYCLAARMADADGKMLAFFPPLVGVVLLLWKSGVVGHPKKLVS